MGWKGYRFFDDNTKKRRYGGNEGEKIVQNYVTSFVDDILKLF